MGILIVEDILAIVLIALLSGMARTGSLQATAVAFTLGKLVVFLVVLLVGGLIIVPRLLAYVARFNSNEMLLIAVLGLCFGVCLIAFKLGYSVALGAFLIGAIIAESRQISKIERLTEPIRDMFSAVFFVAMGLLIEPRVLLQYWFPILVISFAVVVGKVLTCSFGAYITGNDVRTSLRVGMGLAQIGEFSFIIASLGLSLGATSKFLYPIAVTVSAITTFLTPYLIRSADGLVGWVERAAPRPLANYLDIYTQWVGRRGRRQTQSAGGALIRKWTWQMALNVVLMAAIFISAAFLARQRPAWLPRIPGASEDWNPLFWLAAILLSLPLLIATYRKLQAMGLLVSEMTVSQSAAGERTAAIRALIAQVIPLAGAVLLGLTILVLSSAILPPLNVMVLLLLIAGFTTWLSWRSMVRMYARAQLALRETLSQPPPAKSAQTIEPFETFLKDAELKTVTVSSASPIQGKLIRDLDLRPRTGASIVAIERAGRSIVNPAPDEELRVGDTLLLLGSGSQLLAAVASIENGKPENPPG
jgi:CPA2 family monovalent cation:H+ antiporter-2